MCEITQQESDFLDAMVNGICNHYDEWLNRIYMWPMKYGKPINGKTKKTKYERETIDLFTEKKKGYHHKITTQKGNELKKTIDAILDWGGIGKRKKAVEGFYENIDRIKTQQSLRDVLQLGQNQEDADWRIASWSKILSAYDPAHYFIYDSRVAIALVYISLNLGLDVIWEIPNLRKSKKDKPALDAFKEKYKLSFVPAAKDREDRIPRCYCLYLHLLKKLAENKTIIQQVDNQIHQMNANVPPEKVVSIVNSQERMAHLEKMLFMMKESILQEYQPGHNKKKKTKKRV